VNLSLHSLLLHLGYVLNKRKPLCIAVGYVLLVSVVLPLEIENPLQVDTSLYLYLCSSVL
jgi:hypothetical protein